MIQVAFYKGRKRVFNRLVSWWLRGPYSHCELVLQTSPDGVSLCASASFMDGGVRVKNIVLDPEHWDLVMVEGSPATAWQWAASHEEDGYDLLGLLGFVWRRQADDQSKWFCSEAVAAMLGLPKPWRFDPMVLHAALTGGQPTDDKVKPQGGGGGGPVEPK